MIADLREQLAADLREAVGVPVHAGWPDRLTPPCVLLTPPQTTYVTAGPNFGEFSVSLDMALMVPKASPAEALSTLDALIETALTYSADWSLSGVDGPAVVSVNGIEYLGTVAHLSKHGRI